MKTASILASLFLISMAANAYAQDEPPHDDTESPIETARTNCTVQILMNQIMEGVQTVDEKTPSYSIDLDIDELDACTFQSVLDNAWKLSEDGKFDEADAVFKVITEYYDDDVERITYAYLTWGHATINQGKFKNAEEHFTSALSSLEGQELEHPSLILDIHSGYSDLYSKLNDEQNIAKHHLLYVHWLELIESNVWIENTDGTVTHKFSGIVVPSSLNGIERYSLHIFDNVGRDVSITFKGYDDAHNEISLYISYYPQTSKNEHFEFALDDIRKRFVLPDYEMTQMISKSENKIPKQKVKASIAHFQFSLPPNKEPKYFSGLILNEYNGLHIKARVTFEGLSISKGKKRIKQIIEEIPWPSPDWQPAQ